MHHRALHVILIHLRGFRTSHRGCASSQHVAGIEFQGKDGVCSDLATGLVSSFIPAVCFILNYQNYVLLILHVGSQRNDLGKGLVGNRYIVHTK